MIFLAFQVYSRGQRKPLEYIEKERSAIEQIKNGFAEYYYLTEQGKLYNASTKQYLKLTDKHTYKIKTTEGKYRNMSLKQLYKMVFDKVFCIDNITNENGEIWREIENTDHKYFVSNKGRIKSYWKYEAILLKPTITPKGYERLQIIQDGITLNKYVHILVATSFPEDCGKPKDPTYQVHHKDGNGRNNRSENLVWISEVEHLKIHNKFVIATDKK